MAPKRQRLDVVVEHGHDRSIDGCDQQRFGARVAEVEQRPDDDERVQIPQPEKRKTVSWTGRV